MRTMAAALALCGTGCSFLLTPSVSATPQSPIPERVKEANECSPGRGAPIMDVVGAISWGALGAGLIGDASPHRSCFITCHETEDDPGERGIGVALLALAALHVAGAVAGFGHASDCRDVIDSVVGLQVTPPPQWAPPPGAIDSRLPPPEGDERGACHLDHTCNDGLSCASGFCVRLPPPGPPTTPGVAPGSTP